MEVKIGLVHTNKKNVCLTFTESNLWKKSGGSYDYEFKIFNPVSNYSKDRYDPSVYNCSITGGKITIQSITFKYK